MSKAVFQEYGSKYGGAFLYQEVMINGTLYLMNSKGVVHESTIEPFLPEVKDADIIKAVQEAAAKQEDGWNV